MQIKYPNVEVEEIDSAMLMRVKLAGSSASTANDVPCHSSLILLFAFPNFALNLQSSEEGPDQISKT